MKAVVYHGPRNLDNGDPAEQIKDQTCGEGTDNARFDAREEGWSTVLLRPAA